MSTMVYPVIEARRRLSGLLKEAIRTGEVRIIDEDGSIFIIKLESTDHSPFEIEGIDLGLTTSEIIDSIRQARARIQGRPGDRDTACAGCHRLIRVRPERSV